MTLPHEQAPGEQPPPVQTPSVQTPVHAPAAHPPSAQTWHPATGEPWRDEWGEPPAVAWAEPQPPAPRRRRGLWIGLSIAGVVLIAAIVAAIVIWSTIETQRRIDEARPVSPAEQAVVDATVADTADTAAQISERTAAYRDAAANWSASEAAASAWQNETDTPSVEVPNPGGSGLPGGDSDERALLNEIGASDVQIILDAGEQNCGFSSAAGNPRTLAIGGCYNPTFRDWLFLAWDSGITADQIWPIFVHEAMHWYQWQTSAVLFESASRAGIDGEAYRGQIESDASCRAVYQHGIDASEYAASSSPCDVDGWYDGWLRDQLAGLGVPVSAPDPAAYEVQEAVRP